MAEGGGIEPLGRNAYPGFQDQLPTIQRHPLDEIGPPAGSRTQVFRLSGGCSTVELQENDGTSAWFRPMNSGLTVRRDTVSPRKYEILVSVVGVEPTSPKASDLQSDPALQLRRTL